MGDTSEINSNLKTSIRLQKINESLKEKNSITLSDIVTLLSSEGSYILIIILIAPFLFPVSFPGSSTPFGFLIILISIATIFDRNLYLPKKIASIEVSKETLNSFFGILEKFLGYLERIVKPRGKLTSNKLLSKFNLIIIIILAGLLLLPLPVPLTDFIPALAILILSISNLEEDTYVMILGYLATIGALLYFYSIGAVGIEIIKIVLNKLNII
ncbi:MAG: exopolysaccharide biosynthesis protein [Methanosphaera stadtmanae]|nr:exopolysaccharide biosynthesis protein [Methanosphaera stadtmanae]